MNHREGKYEARQEILDINQKRGITEIMTKCKRIGGCLLEIGLDHCCCQTNTCDGQVLVREAAKHLFWYKEAVGG